jgi:hypothetical protein
LRCRRSLAATEAEDEGHGPVPGAHLQPARALTVRRVQGELESDRLGPELKGAILILDLEDHLVDAFDHSSLLASTS